MLAPSVLAPPIWIAFLPVSFTRPSGSTRLRPGALGFSGFAAWAGATLVVSAMVASAIASTPEASRDNLFLLNGTSYRNGWTRPKLATVRHHPHPEIYL